MCVSVGRIMSSPSDPITSSVAKVVQPTATASSVRVSGPSNFFFVFYTQFKQSRYLFCAW